MVSLRYRATLALALPPVAWFAFEQGLSAVLHADCSRQGIGLLWAAASLGLCGLSARLAWPLRRPQSQLVTVWVARLAFAIAGIFGLAIFFQSLAILMVPTCLR